MTTKQRAADDSAAAGAAEPNQPPEDSAARELAEMRERFAALESAFVKLQESTNAAAAAPAPEREPDPITHGLVLACGDVAEAPNPHASHHWCEVHGVTVPVKSAFEIVAA